MSDSRSEPASSTGHQRREDERQVVGDDLVDRAHRGEQRVLVVRAPAAHEQADDLHRRDGQEEQDADVEVGDARARARTGSWRRSACTAPGTRSAPGCRPQRSACRGTMSSFIISLSASAIGCSQPCGADAVGPDARLHARRELPLEQRDVGDDADHDARSSTMKPGSAPRDRRQRGHAHRSTSPNTGSTEPMIATTSATLWPGMMCGSTDEVRERRAAPLHAVRLGAAVGDQVAAHLAARRLRRARSASPFGTLTCATDFTPGPRGDRAPRAARRAPGATILIDSRNSTIRTR